MRATAAMPTISSAARIHRGRPASVDIFIRLRIRKLGRRKMIRGGVGSHHQGATKRITLCQQGETKARTVGRKFQVLGWSEKRVQKVITRSSELNLFLLASVNIRAILLMKSSQPLQRADKFIDY